MKRTSILDHPKRRSPRIGTRSGTDRPVNLTDPRIETLSVPPLDVTGPNVSRKGWSNVATEGERGTGRA